jgi:hypothetical protein
MTAVPPVRDLQAYVAGFLVFAAATLLVGWRLWRIVALRVFGRTVAAVQVEPGKLTFEVPGRGELTCDRSRYSGRTGRNGKLEAVYYPRNLKLRADRDEVPGYLTITVLVVFVAWTTSMCGLMLAEMAG